MPIQIAVKPGGFTSSAIIDGVLYAINNGADVINLSIQVKFPRGLKVTNKQLEEMQGGDDELFWNELFKIANDSNITIVFCAGNQEVLISLDAMKRDHSVITVSATNDLNEKAVFLSLIHI